MFHFMEEFQLRMKTITIELNYHHFAAPNELMDLRIDHHKEKEIKKEKEKGDGGGGRERERTMQYVLLDGKTKHQFEEVLQDTRSKYQFRGNTLKNILSYVTGIQSVKCQLCKIYKTINMVLSTIAIK